MTSDSVDNLKAAIDDLFTKREPWRWDEPRPIEHARIEHTPGQSYVWATIEGDERVVFSYYADELKFRECEFPDLTIRQARDLHYQRDVAYLRS